MATASKVYEKIWLSDYFHGFPHINFDFKRVNSTFDPENSNYRQSLAVLVLFPVAVSLLLWLVYLVYFIARCCQKKSHIVKHKGYSSVCFTGLVILFTLLAICLTGYGFFQNEHMHNGVGGVELAVSNINNTITLARADLTNLENIADQITDTLAASMEASAEAIPDVTVKKKVMEMIEQMRQQAVAAKGDLQVVADLDTSQDYLTDVHQIVHEVEHYRWIATIGLFVIYAVLFVCILIGLLKRWKQLLVIIVVFGVLLAVLFWAFFGVYLGSSVGLGDFCIDPTVYFVKALTGSDTAAELVEYLKCVDPSRPYQSIIIEAQTALTHASNALDAVAQNTRPYQLPGFEDIVKDAENDIQQAQGNLSSILTNVGTCTVLHNYYVDGVNSACRNTLESVAILLLVSALLAVLSAIMIFFISSLWRNYGKRPSSQYVNADDSDPFLPRPPPYEYGYGSIARASPRAWSDRAPLRTQHSTLNEDQVMFMRHEQALGPREESPPPAYHSGQFSPQYMEAVLSSPAGKPRNQ